MLCSAQADCMHSVKQNERRSNLRTYDAKPSLKNMVFLGNIGIFAYFNATKTSLFFTAINVLFKN